MNKLLKIFNLITINNLKLGIHYLKNNGIHKFISQFFLYTSSDKSNYNYYIKKNRLHKSILDSQSSVRFKNTPFFQIIYPYNNIHIKLLLNTLELQTYKNWDLFIPCTLKKHIPSKTNLHFFDDFDSLITSGYEYDYIVFFNEYALSSPDLLFEAASSINEDASDFIYYDEDIISSAKKRSNPYFKSDYNYDMLMQQNYIGNNFCISRHAVQKIFDITHSSCHKLMNDCAVYANRFCHQITHISKILIHNLNKYSLIDSDKYKLSIAGYFTHYNIDACITSNSNDRLRISYKLLANPFISIIIPNKDHIEDLSKCINSIFKSTYTNYEIIIVENNSTEEKTFHYYQHISQHAKVKIIKWNKEFNYSAINNFAVTHAAGEFILFLNNDTEVICADWLEEMLMYAQRKDVGIVGSLLLYPDNTVQHAGVILGIQGIAGHSHKNFPAADNGYFNRLCLVQDYSCVTAACMMIRKTIFQEVNQFDEQFKVAFNDIDLCLKVRQQNYLIVYTPYAKLYHYESKSRGIENTPEKLSRFQSEINHFRKKWQKLLDEGDPYYNKNLTLLYEDFSLKRKIEYKNNFSFY
ncbi:MAG: glycosyltransferase [Lachnospiraceae bacterium]|nr:glycosyltransferase [Lachnospiraceae bacterium]